MVENDIENNIETDIIELPSQDSLKQENKRIKLARLDKEKGICSSCHRKRVIKNKEFNLCSICDSAKKYWGDFNYKQNENKAKDTVNNDRPDDKVSEIQDDNKKEIMYCCDNCNKEISYGAIRCKNCNTINNWLNTPLVNDNRFLVCGGCGAIQKSLSETICWNCGNRGD